MPTPIDPTRLPRLKTAHAAYSDDDQLSQQQLAEIYDVSPARLSSLIKSRFDSFPPAERRADKTNWYPARAAIRAMIAYLEGNSEKKQEQARRHTAIMSGVAVASEAAAAAAPAAEAPVMATASELDKLVSAQLKAFRLAAEQGKFIRRDTVEAITRAALQLFTRELTNLPQTMDPNGTLPPDQKTALGKRARSIVVKLNAALAELLGDEDAGRAGAAAGTGSGDQLNRRRRTVRPSG